jgi:hypothetical protein
MLSRAAVCNIYPKFVGSYYELGYNCLGIQHWEISEMSQPTLDERVTNLEHEVAVLAQSLPKNDRGWQSSAGMFAGDDVMKEIINEGKAIRERDREQSGV